MQVRDLAQDTGCVLGAEVCEERRTGYHGSGIPSGARLARCRRLGVRAPQGLERCQPVCLAGVATRVVGSGYNWQPERQLSLAPKAYDGVRKP